MAPTRFALKTFRPLDVSVPRPRRFSPRGFDPRRSGHKTFRAYTFRPTDPQDVSVLYVTAPRRFGPQMFRPVDPIGILTPPRRSDPWTFQTLEVAALDVPDPGRAGPGPTNPGRADPGHFRLWTFQTLDVPDPGRSDPGRFRPETFQIPAVPDPGLSKL